MMDPAAALLWNAALPRDPKTFHFATVRNKRP